MDQAMGDLQAQLEEMRRLWEEERLNRQRLEDDLSAAGVRAGGNTSHVRSRSPDDGKSENGEGDDQMDDVRSGKRQRVD